MYTIHKIHRLFVFWLLTATIPLFGQKENPVHFVNPFIGTTQTGVPSKWGSDGGTYPGAVAPWGAIQLSPETRTKQARGYDYNDTLVFCFTCTHHMSGYPGGSGGIISVMPVSALEDFRTGEYSRAFSHQDEKSEAGYYSLLFRDNNTRVEASASERTGMFRFTFPAGVKPVIFIGDAGDINARSRQLLEGSRGNVVFQFNKDFNTKSGVKDGCILSFPVTEKSENIVILKMSTSTVDLNGSLDNLSAEAAGWDFDRYRKNNQQKWTDVLSVIEVNDPSVTNKTIFYTALYHAMLLPWVSSDVNGKYRGADGKVYQTKGKNEYTGFSPWDTFRTLHPLLCLIAPDRQNDMICSLLDHYEQSGQLPKGPMTGNHVLAILVDSYLKDVKGYDSTLAYQAMSAALEAASREPDFAAYEQLGYVPATFFESVTKTVEFAYNDWVLAQFAGKIMHKNADYDRLLKRSLNYRNLFYPEVLAMVPRHGNTFIREPENFGYKEGDKWSYSLFVPHNPQDLINLTGGPKAFSARLDSALEKHYIVFDNEPVLHVPYLFNYAGVPDKTQQWVRNILQTHYLNSPGGLPGNDDLGSMSSWYVFSAMGFAPVCPGRPVYALGSPLFREVILHLREGKKFIIRAQNSGEDQVYVKKVLLNGVESDKLYLSHQTIMEGGELNFRMSQTPLRRLYNNRLKGPSEMTKPADIKVEGFDLSLQQVEPGEPFWVRFTVGNSGSPGTTAIRLYTDGTEHASKNIFLETNQSKTDSLECRVYPVGKQPVRIGDLPEKKIEVVSPVHSSKKADVITLDASEILRAGKAFRIRYRVQNKGGYRLSDTISVYVDGRAIHREMVVLEPGKNRTFELPHVLETPGFHTLHAGSKTMHLKVYSENTESKIIDFSGAKISGDTIVDRSGLSNHGIIRKMKPVDAVSSGIISTGDDTYIEIDRANSLDKSGETITVMAWVKPTGENRGLTDIITKGDFIVLQSSAWHLSFFAGGWGRGAVSARLSTNWYNNWHHIAGVSDGNSLKLFIDGNEAGNLDIGRPVDLSTKARWMIGRNEEFPGERIFRGVVAGFKVLIEPLTPSDIENEWKNGLPSSENTEKPE